MLKEELEFMHDPSVVTFGAPTILRSAEGTSKVNQFLLSKNIILENVVTTRDPVARILVSKFPQHILEYFSLPEIRYNPAGRFVTIYKDEKEQTKAVRIKEVPDIYKILEVNAQMITFIEETVNQHLCETYMTLLRN